MWVKKDLTNKRFGKLIAIETVGKDKGNNYIWKCKCDCGNEKEVISTQLTQKIVQSCGCLRRENLSKIGKKNKTHGDAKNKKVFCFYHKWQTMKDRCDNPNNKSYKHYGGRGIGYPPRWDDYINFKEDMYLKYLYAKKQLKMKQISLERIDVNGNYCKENCTFIEKSEQAKNTRKSNRKFLAINKTLHISLITNNQHKFAKDYNLEAPNISKCLLKKISQYKGWQFTYIED
jgi:hypothetical protein